jgi:AraC family transcriptional regulator of adaptative response/methylated-DNA-[protein]-cysteine methyltransferase
VSTMAQGGASAAVIGRTDDEARWAAVLGRDARRDGEFFYSVKTTGVFCRPSCPSRRARRENVAFHATAEAARRAGFRPCKRCTPEADGRSEVVAAACARLEGDPAPDLETLAAELGLSPTHLARTFKAATGLTPKAWALQARAERVRGELAEGRPVTAAFHRAGYGSSGRFYAKATAALGMTPGQRRAGGAGTTIRFAFGASWLGAVLVAATDVGVCAVTLGDDRAELERSLREWWFPQATLVKDDPAFAALVAKVVAAVEEPSRPIDLPLDLRGTAFQRRVWQALLEIPAGETRTYAGLAAALGRPKGQRAVGRACATNKVSVLVPCHRVLRTDGSLSGYLWGLERKAKLLAREAGSSSRGACASSPSRRSTASTHGRGAEPRLISGAS